MRFTRIFLAAAVAGVVATPLFAQAAPAKVAKPEPKAEKTVAKVDKKDDKTEAQAQAKTKKAEAKTAKAEDHAEHKAFTTATAAPKKWLAGVKMNKAEKGTVAAIEKKYNTQIATLKKDHLAAEKAGKEDDSQIAAKVQAILDQEKAEIRAALTADQQTKFDANVAGKPAK